MMLVVTLVLLLSLAQAKRHTIDEKGAKLLSAMIKADPPSGLSFDISLVACGDSTVRMSFNALAELLPTKKQDQYVISLCIRLSPIHTSA